MIARDLAKRFVDLWKAVPAGGQKAESKKAYLRNMRAALDELLSMAVKAEAEGFLHGHFNLPPALLLLHEWGREVHPSRKIATWKQKTIFMEVSPQFSKLREESVTLIPEDDEPN